MPRFTAPAPNGDSRKAIQKRAREASMPQPPEQNKRWPFPIAGDEDPEEHRGSRAEGNAPGNKPV